MIGNKPTIGDVELDLQDLVLPVNLLSDEGDESLSPDADPEEEHLPYRVDTKCVSCQRAVRIVVYATVVGIEQLQDLLQEAIGIICPGCSRTTFRHGRGQ
ncbi:E7 protein [Human papillomavirus type 220]|uniref:Protein E7 n=1 Tax=Human papillomavirus type 220 TaxID=2200957 RepID=A0A2S1ZRX0_9PAPI|nr:E7 protein [Human papillomavirus type 220]